MNKKHKRMKRARTSPGEINAFTPKEEEVLRVAADALSKGFPWLYTDERIKRVAMSASFPRSVAGARQDDPLLRQIYYTSQNYRNREASVRRHEIVEMVSRHAMQEDLPVEELGQDDTPGSLPHMVGELGRLFRVRSFEPKTESEFFSRISGDLNYLDTHKPNPGDFAVEALQNAFVGLMQGEYEWGKKGLPTKGKVEEMAKAQLAQDGKEKKSGWTKMLQIAGLDFLPEGRAGRPSRREVDKNQKAKREALTIITQQVNAVYDGSWPKFRDAISSGGKKVYLQQEAERLEQYGRQSLAPDEEEPE